MELAYDRLVIAIVPVIPRNLKQLGDNELPAGATLA